MRLLRETTALPVTDGWYQGDARLALAQGACRLSRRPLAPEDLPAGGQRVWFAPAFTPSPAFGSAYRITPSPKLVDWMFVTP